MDMLPLEVFTLFRRSAAEVEGRSWANTFAKRHDGNSISTVLTCFQDAFRRRRAMVEWIAAQVFDFASRGEAREIGQFNDFALRARTRQNYMRKILFVLAGIFQQSLGSLGSSCDPKDPWNPSFPA